MMQKITTTIRERRVTSPGYYLLVLGNPFDEAVKPGQFVMISVAGSYDPFLKRPYSIYRALPKSETHPEGEIHLLIKEVGRGSIQMGSVLIGTQVEIVGPLGKGFELGPDVKHAVFAAGGIGVAPFVEFAAQTLEHPAKKTIVIGGRTLTDIQGLDDLKALGVAVRIATEDGSGGEKGLVTAPLDALFDEIGADGVAVYSCGPEPMMKAVAALAKRRKLPCQLSLEAIMGCGFGVCLGCVVKNVDGHYVRVCKEGPVMDAYDLEEYGTCAKKDER